MKKSDLRMLLMRKPSTITNNAWRVAKSLMFNLGYEKYHAIDYAIELELKTLEMYHSLYLEV